MTTSKLLRRSVIGLLIAVAIGVHCVGRTEWTSGGEDGIDGITWGAETHGYGWPWVAYWSDVYWKIPDTPSPTIELAVYTHEPIRSVEWLRPPTSHGSSTLFVIPALCNIGWRGALIHLVHRALTPSPDFAGRRGVTLRWSVRGLLALQLLAAVAIGLGHRW